MCGMRVFNTTLLALSVVTLLGCAGGGSVSVRRSAPGAKVLPPIPANHGASELTETLLNGIEVYVKSAGATEQGTALSLGSTPGGYEWAMYRFNPGTQALDSVAVLLSVPLGSSVWIALSDYSAGRWCMHGPYTKGKTLALDDAQCTSPAGDVYVAVVVSGGSTAMVEQLSVRTVRPTNEPPTAALQSDMVSGDTPLTVHFDASLSNDPDGVIRYYLWDFDGDGVYDGTTLTGLAVFTYTQPGVYDAGVAAVDDCGAYGLDTEQISVNVPGNIAPVPALTATPDSGDTPLAVRLDASVSNDPDGSIVKYEWDFDGEGSYDSYGTSSYALHPYSNPGLFMARVRVTDNVGAQSVAVASVRVNEMPEGPSAWWCFGRDARHTRRSPFTGPQTNHVSWFYATSGAVQSSPAIAADGTIYVGSNNNNLFAINPDGSLRWLCATGDLVHSSPAVGPDGTVYVGSLDAKLYAVNPDGSLKWTYTAGDGLDSSPAIGSDGTIYVGCNDAKLYAINPDGTLKWAYAAGLALANSSPAVGADGTVYIGGVEGKLYAIRPNGTLRWNYPTADEVQSSPAIGPDGMVYFGSRDGHLYAIRPDGTFAWGFYSGGWMESSPALALDGTVYVGCLDSKLYAIKPDGTLKWGYGTGGAVTSSPAIGADGMVYVGCGDGRLYAIKPDGTLKWSYSIGGAVTSSPAIGAGGTLYVGSGDGRLYAFGP